MGFLMSWNRKKRKDDYRNLLHVTLNSETKYSGSKMLLENNKNTGSF